MESGNPIYTIMKLILNILLVLAWTVPVHAQAEFTSLDAQARNTRKSEYATPGDLAKALCKDIKNDRDKARALFSWLAANIRYDVKGMERNSPEAQSQEEYEGKLVKQAYRSGKGICMDYALLYKTMAEAVGLECIFISGHAKASVRESWNGHAWNAVKIDGAWKLLDPTWGAGFTDDNNKFQQIFQPGYFFTAPRIFALDHFPDDPKWQLLEAPLDQKAFKTQGTISYGDPHSGISDAEPIGLPLTKAPNGKIELRLKMLHPPSIIQLRMGNRDIQFEQSEKNGWITLRFSPASGRELQVWGGKKTRQIVSTTLLGTFPVN